MPALLDLATLLTQPRRKHYALKQAVRLKVIDQITQSAARGEIDKKDAKKIKKRLHFDPFWLKCTLVCVRFCPVVM